MDFGIRLDVKVLYLYLTTRDQCKMCLSLNDNVYI